MGDRRAGSPAWPEAFDPDVLGGHACTEQEHAGGLGEGRGPADETGGGWLPGVEQAAHVRRFEPASRPARRLASSGVGRGVLAAQRDECPVVFEHVGAHLFQAGLDSLRPGGRLVTCGAHAGEVVPLDIIPFFRAQHSVIGSFVYTRDELEKVLALGARGLIKPLVAATFPLSETRAAMEKLAARDFFGKILVLP